MDIKSVNGAYAANGAEVYKKIEKKTNENSNNKAVSSERKEEVELTTYSKRMQKIMDTIEVLPEVRIQIVEEIKTKIKYNGYPIESNLYKALEKLIENKIV